MPQTPITPSIIPTVAETIAEKGLPVDVEGIKVESVSDGKKPDYTMSASSENQTVTQIVDIPPEGFFLKQSDYMDALKIVQAMLMVLPRLNSHRKVERMYHNVRVEKLGEMAKLLGKHLGADINEIKNDLTDRLESAIHAA